MRLIDSAGVETLEGRIEFKAKRGGAIWKPNFRWSPGTRHQESRNSPFEGRRTTARKPQKVSRDGESDLSVTASKT